ncbi:probable clathrin assembly protein At4g32285 [Glycine soja]|uniref:Putative clathrin assembly protein n=1 Tax=Glycine soja TaxID=3848 RepID=A0A445I5I3_GLYSO|nr:probable clathrin assembly protein At4g32285 [Glycine soja]RZB81280.1 putative clathrin assembly protein [Glycine soja]
MASSTIRKAIGVVKDQTSISIAKVAGNLAPDLEVLIVKATSHEQVPADEKYVREILTLTSLSRSYINASLVTISKRLNKTRDWIVAIKALLLVHRLLVDAHPAFEEEIVHSTRLGTSRILNMSDFRDDAHSNSWDQVGFVRVYSLYLDAKVDFVAYRRKLSGGVVESVEFRDEFGSAERERNEVTPVREMGAERVLKRLNRLLRMLDRVLGCRPSGAAKNNSLVLVALYQVVRDSFKLYAEVCDVLGVLLDRFTEMEYEHCVKAFDSYVSAAKMMDELVGFYGWCKDTGIARSSEYPDVQRITDKLLGTLEGFLKEMSCRPKSPERKLEVKVTVNESQPEADMNKVKALPAPETESFTPPPPMSVAQPNKIAPNSQKQTSDLVDLREDGVSADEQGNKLGAATVRTEGSWEAFPSNGESEVKSAWETPAAEAGKADWELALVENTSNLSRQKADLAGGFDPLLLNGMYDQGAVRQHVSTTQLSGGSASSVALPGPGKSATPVLALPAPDGTVQAVGPQDPFAASLTVPPPSYVQIADMERKQHLLVQEQQLWQQYGRDGMQGQLGLSRVAGAPGYYAPAPQPMMPYGMPQFGGIGQPGGYYPAPYY